ncbi:MAG: O-antigen ligase family protein [Alphaproteobacteria bacterium]|nr:O-antigen ligase family protein [Alphaproteobacteria bacterium]
MTSPSHLSGTDPTGRAATWFTGTLLLVFPAAAVLAKHSMTLIVTVLGVGLLAATTLRIARGAGRMDFGRTFGWILAAAVAYLIWAGLVLLLRAPDCGRCGESWAQLAGEILVFLPLAGLGLAKRAGVRADFILRALGIGLLVAALVLVVELSFDAPIYRTLSGRWDDPRVDLSRFNRGTLALVLVSIPVLGWLWREGGRALVVAAAVPILVVTVLGRSEAALLTAIVALVVALLAAVRPRLTAWTLMIGLTLGSLAAPWIAGPLQVWRVETAQGFPLSIVHRFEIWDHAAHYARLAPWTGWGFGGYRTLPIEGPHSESYVVATHVEAHAHNVALQLWVETGLIGLAIWLILAGLVMRATLALGPGLGPAALAAIAAGVVPALVSFGFWQATYLAILAMMAFVTATARDAGDSR